MVAAWQGNASAKTNKVSTNKQTNILEQADRNHNHCRVIATGLSLDSIPRRRVSFEELPTSSG